MELPETVSFVRPRVSVTVLLPTRLVDPSRSSRVLCHSNGYTDEKYMQYMRLLYEAIQGYAQSPGSVVQYGDCR